MLDSVGIRLPKYKVRELTLGMKESGDIGVGDIIEKMTFIQVTMIMNCWSRGSGAEQVFMAVCPQNNVFRSINISKLNIFSWISAVVTMWEFISQSNITHGCRESLFFSENILFYISICSFVTILRVRMWPRHSRRADSMTRMLRWSQVRWGPSTWCSMRSKWPSVTGSTTTWVRINMFSIIFLSTWVKL